MTRSLEPKVTSVAAPSAGARERTRVERYTGEVVYIYAFDLAYEMRRLPIRELLGQPVAQFMVDSSKRSPRQLFFYRPQMVRMPPLERIGPRGPVRVERTVKILPIGAISITIRVPFEVDHIEELVDYHDLRFSNGSLHEEARQLAEEVRQELKPYFIRPAQNLSDDEAYTVFCVRAPLQTLDGSHLSTEEWLDERRREVAALLTQEPDVAHLSDQEASESTARYHSYYDHDMVVVDWDAALIIDEPQHWEEVLYLMELANLQLAELEAYDRLLDEATERAYRDLGAKRFKGRRQTLRDLAELRIDMSRLQDELSNITKFFGDWHLAKIYQTLSARFHLADWHKTIDEKLKTLDELYQLAKQDQSTRYMLVLELMIVLLFIVDLIVLFRGK